MGLIPYVDTDFVFHYRDKQVKLDKKDQELQIEDLRVCITNQTRFIRIDTRKNSFYFMFEDEEGFKKVDHWEFSKQKWRYDWKEVMEIRRRIGDSIMAKLIMVIFLMLMVFWLPTTIVYIYRTESALGSLCSTACAISSIISMFVLFIVFEN